MILKSFMMIDYSEARGPYWLDMSLRRSSMVAECAG